MELLAEGRNAEVFAWADGRVLKLDRLEWNGFALLEATVLEAVVAAGVPAPHVYETVMVGDRHGLVLERIDGPLLSAVVGDASDLTPLVVAFVELQRALNERVIPQLPDLVVGLADGLRASGLAPASVDELTERLHELDDGARSLCHFDLHPRNVIVGAAGWVVIDWLTASSGPPAADFARTLVLDRPGADTVPRRFMQAVAREGRTARAIDREGLDAWIRIVAGARLAEGFEGEHAAYLTALATGTDRLDY